MYLDKINHLWTQFREANGLQVGFRITNTARLQGTAQRYMLEWELSGRRYHLYHALGEKTYELLSVEEDYPCTSLEAVFGIKREEAEVLLCEINRFMLQHYEGIQTFVDAAKGLERAKAAILKARLQRP